MSNPFSVGRTSEILKDKYYLDVSIMESVKKSFSLREVRGLVSAYFTQGIPYAFKQNPLVFEDMKKWIAEKLSINSYDITITGSSRLGFSLSHKKWGKPYSEDSSDLDMIIVSAPLFEKYRQDFKLYAADVQSRIDKKIRIGGNEIKNIVTVNDTILKRGFIDQNKIPIQRRYSTIYNASDLLYKLTLRLKHTDNCPKPSYISFRTYKDWTSCYNQLVTNLHVNLSKL